MGYYTEACAYCGRDIWYYETWGVVPGVGYAHLNCRDPWDELGYRLTAVPVPYSSLQGPGC